METWVKNRKQLETNIMMLVKSFEEENKSVVTNLSLSKSFP